MAEVYEYEGFLTEEKLGDCLRFVFGEENVRSQVKIPNTKMSWDYEVTLPNGKMYVEFDGHFHYTTANALHNDQRKASLAQQEGALVVRIPYFIQFDWRVFVNKAQVHDKHRHICSDLASALSAKTATAKNFGHGFHAPKVTLPASFTRRGVVRFEKEVAELAYSIRVEIAGSLDQMATKLHPDLVYP